MKIPSFFFLKNTWCHKDEHMGRLINITRLVESLVPQKVLFEGS